MKDSDTRYFDPLTGSGQAVPGSGMRFWVHEAGHMLLDASWNHAEVRSPFWRAYYNPAGGAAIRVEGRRVPLGPDRVILIPPLCVFDCVPKAGVEHVWIHFSADAPLMRAAHRVLKPDPEEVALWGSLARRLAEGEEPHRLFHLTRACLHLIWNHLPAGEGQEPGRRMRAWLALIQNRLNTPPSLDEMAAELGMGRRTFLRWFKTQTHRTPADYAMDLRIREACVRLRYSEATIDDIAEATGFADRHHFSRVFKQRAGLSPAAWRQASVQ